MAFESCELHSDGWILFEEVVTVHCSNTLDFAGVADMKRDTSTNSNKDLAPMQMQK